MASARPMSAITAAIAYKITEPREEKVFAAVAAEALRLEFILRSYGRFNCCIDCCSQGGRMESSRRNRLVVNKNGRRRLNPKSTGALLVVGDASFDFVAIPISFKAG